MYKWGTEAQEQKLVRQLGVIGLLLVCALAAPLPAALMLRAQLDLDVPHQSHEVSHHGTRDPKPPTHERHQPFCFLCVLGPVLLVVLPLRVQEQVLAITEQPLRQDFPARERPFEPQSRSRAPPSLLV
jgi:hypothetical protein